ncbi:MAG: hypothetical protein K0R65_1449 [Crocinitomicaceae bacterium]|jgi:hypothetical protein|nr:hypothetical protein [Crocinitomicaceae bacterium]
MARLILFNFLFCCSLGFSQEVETIHVTKELREQDFYPQIEGIFTGEIDVLTLGSPQGIITSAGWKITSFTLGYPSGRDYNTVTVNSNVFPDDLIREIVRSALKEQIYLTDIMAVDPGGTKHLLKSMVLTPLPGDEK